MKRAILGAGVVALALMALVVPGAPATDTAATPVQLDEFRLSTSTMDVLRGRWLDQLESTYGAGHWAPMRMVLDDADLALMGLPPKRVLTSHRYPEPTWFDAQGNPHRAGGKTKGGGGSTTSDSGVVAVAGAGWAGIRPGALLLTITSNEVGWCSAAHVYGSPGSYQISTAGHCGKTGGIVTMIGAVGSHRDPITGAPVPVLLDIGKYSKSTGDAGLGKDWALIGVYSNLQNLVTPTMALWGGPKGMYTKTGEVASVSFGRSLIPTPSVTADPFLAQDIVHYGHGTGIGTGGTGRTAAVIAWRTNHYMFTGAITPGDSGSGSNTLTGDSVGAERECAGINTHLWIDSLMRDGIGIMGGTRCTQVQATLADGQLIPYPAPAPGLP